MHSCSGLKTQCALEGLPAYPPTVPAAQAGAWGHRPPSPLSPHRCTIQTCGLRPGTRTAPASTPGHTTALPDFTKMSGVPLLPHLSRTHPPLERTPKCVPSSGALFPDRSPAKPGRPRPQAGFKPRGLRRLFPCPGRASPDAISAGPLPRPRPGSHPPTCTASPRGTLRPRVTASWRPLRAGLLPRTDHRAPPAPRPPEPGTPHPAAPGGLPRGGRRPPPPHGAHLSGGLFSPRPRG